ncbi:MAG: hypothetical protein BroJett025_02640 [Patescibacteria group bacterium]|nr:MAG: hypothetical protein BroJett025_02640 [Patescibacteria group bacterium]
MPEISRQRKYQLRMGENGRCRQCGKPRDNEFLMCDACRKKHKLQSRIYRAKKGILLVEQYKQLNPKKIEELFDPEWMNR